MNITISMIQDIGFNILCDIDSYCKKNGIKYALSGGTCLGAIRHKGFIPWDDDIDIMMPRTDYQRFFNGFENEYGDRYGSGEVSNDSTWTLQFGRIWDKSTKANNVNLNGNEIGVWIDIFPIDGLPRTKMGQKVFYSKLKTLNVMKHAAQRRKFKSDEKHRVVKRLIQLVCKPIGAHRISNRMNDIAQRYKYEMTPQVAVSLACHYWERETINKELLDETVMKEFNGREFPVPRGYDIYLSNLYGNYQIIPEEARKRGNTHISHWDISFQKERKEE